MGNKLTMEITADKAAKIEAAIKQCMAAIQRANKQMTRDQVEIDRLKSETRAMLAQLKAA